MNKELKQAIIKWVIENENALQLTNDTTNQFKAYIFDEKGEWLIGGQEISNFIDKFIDLYTEYEPL